MTWVLLWTVLVLGAAALLFVLVRRLWRRARALVSELGAASGRLGEVADSLAALESSRPAAPGVGDGVGSSGPRRRS